MLFLGGVLLPGFVSYSSYHSYAIAVKLFSIGLSASMCCFHIVVWAQPLLGKKCVWKGQPVV